MRLTMSVGALAALLTTGICLAEEEQLDGAKHLQEWGDYIVEGDWTTVNHRGNKVTSTTEWIGDRKFLKETTTVVTENGIRSGLQVYSVDPVTKKLKVWWFMSIGIVVDVSMEPTDNGWIRTGIGLNPRGKEVKSVIDIKIIDKHTYERTWLKLSVDGVKQEPNGQSQVWTHTKGKPKKE